MDLKELLERRGKLIHDMKAVVDRAEAEKRDLTDEENARHGDLFKQQESVAGQIAVQRRQTELDREMAAAQLAREDDERKARPGEPRSVADLRMEGFRAWLCGRQAAAEAAAAFRALQADSDTAGGYLVAPEQFVAQLLKAVDALVFIRPLATKNTVITADSLGVPTLDADPADADWTAELATGSEDSTMAFGKRSLEPHPLAKRIKVSKTLLRKSSLPVEQIVIQRLAYKFAITEEKGFLTGHGAAQPLGVFTASTNGISTARDASTGNTTTSIQTDGLIVA